SAVSALSTASLRPKSVNATPETVATGVAGAATSDEAEPATGFVFCKVTFFMEKPGSPKGQGPGCEAFRPARRCTSVGLVGSDASLRWGARGLLQERTPRRTTALRRM